MHVFTCCPIHAPGDAIRMRSVLNTFSQTPVSRKEKNRRIQERIPVRVFCFSLSPIVYLYHSGAQEKKPCIVPLNYRANGRLPHPFVPRGYISKARKVDTDASSFGCAEAPHVVYVIDYEMAHFLTLCNSLK
ncbi:hypothetical protein V8E53_004499 [Lactarius tabidus]